MLKNENFHESNYWYIIYLFSVSSDTSKASGGEKRLVFSTPSSEIGKLFETCAGILKSIYKDLGYDIQFRATPVSRITQLPKDMFDGQICVPLDWLNKEDQWIAINPHIYAVSMGYFSLKRASLKPRASEPIATLRGVKTNRKQVIFASDFTQLYDLLRKKRVTHVYMNSVEFGPYISQKIGKDWSEWLQFHEIHKLPLHHTLLKKHDALSKEVAKKLKTKPQP